MNMNQNSTAVQNRASGHRTLDQIFRASLWHATDVRGVLGMLKAASTRGV
jgi:uncharacterized protein YunC (DUF1805 family)